LRLCLDRIIAPRRERPIQLAVPPIRSASDIAAAMGAIVKAAAQGTITPDEAFKLSQMVEPSSGRSIPATSTGGCKYWKMPVPQIRQTRSAGTAAG
jgi:hypothetical protein